MPSAWRRRCSFGDTGANAAATNGCRATRTATQRCARNASRPIGIGRAKPKPKADKKPASRPSRRIALVWGKRGRASDLAHGGPGCFLKSACHIGVLLTRLAGRERGLLLATRGGRQIAPRGGIASASSFSRGGALLSKNPSLICSITSRPAGGTAEIALPLTLPAPIPLLLAPVAATACPLSTPESCCDIDGTAAVRCRLRRKRLQF
jgi:hypothetical protein